MEIRNIIVILTYFQKEMILSLFSNLFDSGNTLVLHSSNVSITELKCKSIAIDSFQFSRKKIFNLNFDYLCKTRCKVKELRKALNLINSTNDISKNLTIIIGSEKDVFTQLLLNSNFIKCRSYNLVAVEEGIGYYKTGENFKTLILKMIYRIFTPIVFNEKLDYVYTLGQDSRINEVYARFPKLLPRKKGVTYHEIGHKNGIVPISRSKRKKNILIFSFPNQDVGISNITKQRMILDLVRTIPYDYKITIKPHPREDTVLLSKLALENKITIIDKSDIGEKIDYFEYSHIVNFYSSIILDLLLKRYPLDQVITIGRYNKSRISLFDNTKYIKHSQIKSLTFEGQI